MTAQGTLQILIYIGILVALAKPLGAFMAAVYEGRRTFLSPMFAPLERLIYRLAGVDEKSEAGWKRYALGLLLFNLLASSSSIYCSGCRARCRSIRRPSAR